MPVINMHHHGNRVPFGTIDIMRGSIFGNPFRIGIHGNRDMVVKKYRDYATKRVQTDAEFRQEVLSLRGQDLCCCCAPEACHGDVLVELSDQIYHEEQEKAMQALELVFGPIRD